MSLPGGHAVSESGPSASVGLRAHVVLCRNHYDLMAFATPGESPLRYPQDNRKVSHDHEKVAVTEGPTAQPGHAVNPHAMPCGGNSQ
jgi:hypothetical protein